MTLTVMIQSCCHMPPFATSSSQVLGDTKIPFAIKKEAQAISKSLEGESNAPEFHAVPDLTVQTSAVLVLIRCHQPLWPKPPNQKILYWDWSFHSYVRG